MKNEMKAGDRVRMNINAVAFGGNGIGRINNMVVFVPFSVDGDVIEVEIREIKKKFMLGDIVTIHGSSPARIKPKCPYFLICGGCQYQHILYEHQLELKAMQVAESFERIGKFVAPPCNRIIPSPQEFSYRGKVEFHLDYNSEGRSQIGFMNQVGNTLVDVERCEIVDESINGAYRKFRNDLSMPAGKSLNEERIIFWSGYKESGSGNRPYITREVRGKKFKVPYNGFFQANMLLVDSLVDCVMAMGDLNKSDTVVDCYCGSGLFSLFAAFKVQQVYGIESHRDSIICARHNLQECGLSNAEFFEGKVEKILRNEFIKKNISIDTVLLDPPRIGCSKTVLQGIIDLEPHKIIYISCNPATQARDIKYLAERGFSLKKLQPIDMFPQTKHIEVIALISKED